MYFKFNIDAILRADYKTKVETLRAAVMGSVMTINEARERLDLGTVENGDRLITQGANIFLDQVGVQYIESPAAPPEEGENENAER